MTERNGEAPKQLPILETKDNELNSPRDNQVMSKNYETTEEDQQESQSPRYSPKVVLHQKSNFRLNFQNVQ